jgi:hypothetical protein
MQLKPKNDGLSNFNMTIPEDQFKQQAAKLLKYMMGRLNIKSPPSKLILKKDEENSKKPWAFTGHYNPEDKSITLMVSNRHHVDLLRTFAHEVIHHWQNENGNLKTDEPVKPDSQYAQKNPHLRKMEKQAYLFGNMIFRDFEDIERYGKTDIVESVDGFYKKIINRTKLINLILEMSYDGNVGLHEMMQFFKVASQDEVKQFELFMANNDLPNAWELVQRVVGVRLKGL